MNNNLLEFGGVGSLIATAICDFENNGIFYNKNDVVLNLKDVYVSFNYGSHTTDLKSKRSDLYYNEYFLNSFTIDASPLNLQTQRLFANLIEEPTIVVRHENAMAMGKSILLLGNLKENDEDIENTFLVVDGIKNFQYQIRNGVTIITSEEFENTKHYDVYYNEEINCSSFELDNKDSMLPYLKVQISFTGNEDKNTMQSFIIIDKTSVKLTPLFDLEHNSVSKIRLMFKVVSSDKKPKLSVIRDGREEIK